MRGSCPHNDYQDQDLVARRGGVVAAILYVVVVALVMGLVRCDTSLSEEEELSQGSILISFGNSDEGAGELPAEEPQSEVTPPPQPESEPVVEPIATDESSEVEQPTPQEEVPEEPQEVPEAPREVNRRALFPGTTPQKEEVPSQGESTPQGVVGSERGTTDIPSELGSGLSGNFSLAGRSLVGSLPVPQYGAQEQGRVVINITVDEAGYVTSASVKTNASTTNSSILIEAAREAALKARFSTSDSFVQSGTITYIFKLN